MQQYAIIQVYKLILCNPMLQLYFSVNFKNLKVFVTA